MITKEIFEQYVPAFLSPTSEVFDKMTVHLDMMETAVADRLGDITPYADTSTIDRLNQYVCQRAAYEAIPQLDLVLTSTGFGIVSNQNLTPASRERVDALREQLRRDSSVGLDLLLFNLLHTKWNTTPQAEQVVQSLLWCPLLLRKHGVTWQGRPVYHEEMDFLLPDLRMAESKLRHVMSDALHEKMLELLRKNTLNAQGTSLGYTLACKIGQDYITALMKDRSSNYAGTLLLDLERVLERYANDMPEYASSKEYEAKHSSRYANQKDDTTFFFG